MALKDYLKKRDFTKTLEPKGSARKKAAYRFVVQKHDATRLHYDFRLELFGILKSWAVPKGPSLNPVDKRLAVMVEDHPYDYRTFEGVIPEGYGAGTVMVWDEGTYYPLNENHEPGDEKTIDEGLQKGEIYFVLEGKKLRGGFALVHMKGKENDWLMIKLKDEFATKEDVTKQDHSVVTGRSLEQIAGNETGEIDEILLQAPKAKMPRRIVPMLASLAEGPFDNEEWLFEMKWDGFRAIAEVEDRHVQLYSRNQLSFNQRFSPIVEELKKLHLDAVFDGEIVVFDTEGKPQFQLVQNYQDPALDGHLVYYIFDLLYYAGRDLRKLPLIERKKLLQAILPHDEHSRIKYSDHVIGKGKQIYAQAEKNQIEGLMAKQIDSVYEMKRSRCWLKIKRQLRQEVIICGYTEPRGSRKKFGALILGIRDKNDYRYAGHVGGGFSGRELVDLWKEMQPYIAEKCPFAKKPRTNTPVTWLTPKLLCEISFTEWTQDGSARHPVFLGLRDDKKPSEVTKEKVVPTPTSESKLKLTNLDKIFWPKEGYTKGDLIDYYSAISTVILPYLKGRPQSLYRFPDGIEGGRFFQKNVTGKVPDWIETIPIMHNGEQVQYLHITDKNSLLFAINMGCIDLNPLNSRMHTIDYPDYLIIDLDPEAIAFDKVIESAQAVHELLEEHHIPSYCKTSGATGMHIYIPMGAKYTYEQVKLFAEVIARITHERVPEFTSVVRKPSQRQGRVYLDFLQNNFGQTVAAPYCVRPRPGAPVSTPLDWKEVKKGLDPLDFTMRNMLQRLEKKGDIFKGVLGKGVDVLACLKKLGG